MRQGEPTGLKPPLLSIALISAATLAYEILLMRLFSIIQWHHFAYMMISLALLGYGASGTFLALARRWLDGRFFVAYIINAVLFGLSTSICFQLAQSFPFNALEVLWDPRQPLWLMLIFLFLFIPFFCAANCICLAFTRYRDLLHRVYCFDLVGAGAGALLVIGLLFIVPPAAVLQVVSAMGLLAAAVACWETGNRKRWLVWMLLLAVGISLSPAAGFSLHISQFKGLSQSLRVLDAELLDQRSSPLGQLTTVKSPTVPFRHTPGLSLNAPGSIPEQLGLFTDADALSVLTQFDGDLDKLAYLDYTSSALPYHLLEQPEVLVLGAGGGSEVLQALQHKAARIDAVELNSQVVDLVNTTFSGFTGALYERPGVTVYNDEIRGFVSSVSSRYDLVQVALLDSFGASSAGLFSLSENYLYTLEAFSRYMDLLKEGGILSITRWTKSPPRDGLKVFATAIEALEQAGITQPGLHLLMIRSWNTSTLLVKNEPFGSTDISRLKAFCRQRWFDLVFYPGMGRDEANRYNQLQQPWYFEGATRLLDSGRMEFMQDYKFNIRPATDDRPYFSHFLKWQTLPELLALRGRGGMPLLEWGYLVLVATLLLALFASFVLVLLPLLLQKRSQADMRGPGWRFIVYFASIGCAFMFIEIAFIQTFILFLHHPLYAVSVVLCAFLVFAGLGSLMSARWCNTISLLNIALGIAVLSVLYVWLLPGIFNLLVPLPGAVRIPVSVLMIAPMACLMGMPFPRGLRVVSGRSDRWIPWAWGINGCASVIGAILATLVAIHLGFKLIIFVAVVLYLLATLALPPAGEHR